MSKKKLIKLPNGNWANPDHVTAIEVKDYIKTQRCANLNVWCKMSGGYGTGVIYYESFDSLSEAHSRADELAAMINA
jgi:hypothetical protein